MASWTLLHVTSETEQTFAAWGLSLPVFEARNQMAGTMHAEEAGDAWADLAFSYEDEVVVKLDGVVFWRGYFIAPVRGIGEDGQENISLEFRDGWHLLERVDFYRGVTGAVSFNTTQVELFAEVIPGVSFSRHSIGYELAAVTAHAGVTIGTYPASYAVTPPPVMLRSPTCADTIRAILRKLPDTITRWVHGESSSVLHFQQRSGATSRTVALSASGAVISKRILPRYDLQVRGVVVTWVYNTEEGEVTAAEDTAGSTSGARILRDTITLPPPVVIPAQTESVTVLSETYDESTAAFWQAYGGLAQDAGDIVVNSSSNSSSFSKVLLGGSIPGWMTLSAHAETAQITGDLSLRIWRTPGTPADGYTVQTEKRTINLPVTDLSGTYSRTIFSGSLVVSDEPITGIAAALYASLSTLAYEGELTLCEEEITGTIRPGDLLNLSGGRSEWSTMAAQVHSVQWHPQTGRTRISFGPSLHLSVGDFADLLREVRRDPNVVNLESRSAAPGSLGTTEVMGGVPYCPPTAPTSAATPEEFKVVVNEWEFSWKADGGKLTIKKEGDTSRQFLVNMNAGTFADCFQLHVPGPADEQVILKPRPTKICLMEDDELVQKDVLIFRSDHVEDLTY